MTRTGGRVLIALFGRVRRGGPLPL